jgi:hypothetical protein
MPPFFLLLLLLLLLEEAPSARGFRGGGRASPPFLTGSARSRAPQLVVLCDVGGSGGAASAASRQDPDPAYDRALNGACNDIVRLILHGEGLI